MSQSLLDPGQDSGRSTQLQGQSVTGNVLLLFSWYFFSMFSKSKEKTKCEEHYSLIYQDVFFWGVPFLFCVWDLIVDHIASL